MTTPLDIAEIQKRITGIENLTRDAEASKQAALEGLAGLGFKPDPDSDVPVGKQLAVQIDTYEADVNEAAASLEASVVELEAQV